MKLTKRDLRGLLGYSPSLDRLDQVIRYSVRGMRLHNTEVPVDSEGNWSVILHGWTILHRDRDDRGRDRITITLAGWPTATTRDRLNRFLPGGFRVYQQRHSQYLDTPDGPRTMSGWRGRFFTIIRSDTGWEIVGEWGTGLPTPQGAGA